MAKFIATRHFRNNCELEIKDAIHEHHIHKGATFSIGKNGQGEIPLEDIKLMKSEDKVLIATLLGADCIRDASDEKVVAKILAEVKVEATVEKRAIETARQAGSSADIVAQLVAALKGMQKAPA